MRERDYILQEMSHVVQEHLGVQQLANFAKVSTVGDCSGRGYKTKGEGTTPR